MTPLFYSVFPGLFVQSHDRSVSMACALRRLVVIKDHLVSVIRMALSTTTTEEPYIDPGITPPRYSVHGCFHGRTPTIQLFT